MRLLVLLLLLLHVLLLLLVSLCHLLRLLLVPLFDLLHSRVVRPLLFQLPVILLLPLLEFLVVLLLPRVQLFLLLLVFTVTRVGWLWTRMRRQFVGVDRMVHLSAGISRLRRPVVVTALAGGHGSVSRK